MEVSEWSTCLSRKIGTVIVRDDILISTGFNGPPRGVTHCGEARVFRDKSLPFIPIQNRNECPRRAMGYRSGQGLEFCTASHAEENAIINAARIGISTLGTKMYMNCGIPCRECLKKIINSGIVEIICMNLDDWYDELSKFLVKESDLIIRNYANERIE
jgi:dCMP deaminase